MLNKLRYVFFMGVLFAVMMYAPSLVLAKVSSTHNDGWTLSAFMGGSISMDNTLSFHFSDQADQVLRAKYDNKSFTDSHWWAFRLERWKGKKSRGMEIIHHKIYLENTNSVIQDFSISDGYNLFYYNFGKKRGRHIYRFGVGVVMGHPDATITGRDRYIVKGFSGHHLAGPTVQFNHEVRVWENKYHFVSLDSKLTFSYAKVPISTDSEEYAVAPDIAVHFSLGIGSKSAIFERPGLVGKALFFLPLAYPVTMGHTLLDTGLFPSEGY